MSDENLNDILIENGLTGSSFFTGDNFFDAIIGYTENGNIIYDYYSMVDCLLKDNSNPTTEDYSNALEWINYNTLRIIPYMPDPKPIISYRLI